MRRSEHIVDRYGRVGCPNLDDVPVDFCLACPAFETIDETDGLQVLRCRPRAAGPSGGVPRSLEPWLRFMAPGG